MPVSEWVYDGDAIKASHTHQVPCLSQNGFVIEMPSKQAIPISAVASAHNPGKSCKTQKAITVRMVLLPHPSCWPADLLWQKEKKILAMTTPWCRQFGKSLIGNASVLKWYKLDLHVIMGLLQAQQPSPHVCNIFFMVCVIVHSDLC